MLANKPWTYQADYFGVCCTIHTLLHGEDLSIVQEWVDVPSAISNVVDSNPEHGLSGDEIIGETGSGSLMWLPGAPVRRYWDISLWGEFYQRLLNWTSYAHKMNLDPLIGLFQAKLLKINEGVKKVFRTQLTVLYFSLKFNLLFLGGYF